jgi:hypothetical protein
MDWLLRLYGLPHEALHALALRLIGRRAIRVARTHIDIPDDLTTRQYVFVAGLPALVFGGITIIAAVALLNAASIIEAAVALLVVTAAGIGAAGTVGDLTLIMERLAQDRAEPSE